MRGFTLPSWLVAVSAALVALALVGFVVTGDPDTDVAGASADRDAIETTPTPADGRANRPRQRQQSNQPDPQPKTDPNKRPEQRVERRTAYVEVYNNSGVTGLASQTGATLQDSGWRVVATDNWYGEIPENTVYYPAQLRAQASLLGRDLGIARLHSAVAPMSFDRITVILTAAP